MFVAERNSNIIIVLIANKKALGDSPDKVADAAASHRFCFHTIFSATMDPHHESIKLEGFCLMIRLIRGPAGSLYAH